MQVIGPGIKPGSDTAHLALFGYEPDIFYTGRGPFEVAGAGMEVEPGDVCFRVNAGTVDKNLIAVDRRAGRINDTSEIAELLNGTEIDGVKILLKKGTAYRLGMILRGKGLSAEVTGSDPKSVGVKVKISKPKDDSTEAKFTAEVINKFLGMAYEKLSELELNKNRVKQGKLAANYLMVRGAGLSPKLPSFENRYALKAACVAGAGLYKGVARLMGMKIVEVVGATGKPDSDLRAKVKKALEISKKHDLVFMHFKGADSLGEDGDVEGKVSYIEKVDEAVKGLLQFKGLVVVTADHSTPCSLKDHSGDDVPVTIKGEPVRDDEVEHFNERECAKGRLGHIRGAHLMPIIIDLMGLAEKFGA